MRAALEACKTNVMVADQDYNIVYMNKTMMEMLESAEADLRKDIPILNVRALIGANIDVFHKNPAHQRRLLDRLDSMFETNLNVGGRNFHLVVTPIRNETSARIGTVVEWKDETAGRPHVKMRLAKKAAAEPIRAVHAGPARACRQAESASSDGAALIEYLVLHFW